MIDKNKGNIMKFFHIVIVVLILFVGDGVFADEKKAEVKDRNNND